MLSGHQLRLCRIRNILWHLSMLLPLLVTHGYLKGCQVSTTCAHPIDGLRLPSLRYGYWS